MPNTLTPEIDLVAERERLEVATKQRIQELLNERVELEVSTELRLGEIAAELKVHGHKRPRAAKKVAAAQPE